MAYQEPAHPDVPPSKSSGVVVPMADGRGNPYPESLRTQQVGLGVVRAICDRIDESLAGGAIKLKTVHLGASGKAHFRNYLLAKLLPELFADPVPAKVRPVRQIVSRKALSLLNGRMTAAFDPEGGRLDLPGVTLTRDDLFELLVLVNETLFADDKFTVADVEPIVAVEVSPPTVATFIPPTVVKSVLPTAATVPVFAVMREESSASRFDQPPAAGRQPTFFD